MEAAAVVTLIGVGITVAALAFYLIRVALGLRHVHDTLDGVIGGVVAIADATAPVGPVLGKIHTDLTATQAALEGLLAKKSGGKAPAPAAATRGPLDDGTKVEPLLVSRLNPRNRTN
jgi:hypothetical protein